PRGFRIANIPMTLLIISFNMHIPWRSYRFPVTFLQYFTCFLSPPLEDVLLVERTDVVEPNKRRQPALIWWNLVQRIGCTGSLSNKDSALHSSLLQVHFQKSTFRIVHN